MFEFEECVLYFLLLKGQNAKRCIIIGSEIANNQLVVKDMATGQQELIEVDKFFANKS